MNKKILTGAALLTATLLVGCSNESGDTVATTKEGKITSEQLYKKMKADAGVDSLQYLILEKALEPNVKNTKEIKDEVTAQVASQVAQYGGDEKVFEVALKRSGLSNVQMYKDSLYVAKMMDKYIESKIDTSDKELKAFYEKWTPKIEADHILVQNEDEAKELIKQINEGADFAELAKKHSLDSGSAQNGGKLQPFGKGEMDPAFEAAAYALEKEGEVTQTPVKSQYGFHIIKLIKGAKKEAFDKAKEEIKKEYIDQKIKDSNFRQDIIAQLIKDEKVEVKDKDLSNVMDYFKTAEEQQKDIEEQQKKLQGQGQQAEPSKDKKEDSKDKK
ncbi:peptidylprolyl isomerase [Atopobacter phocae]|uniref:peptidylprolyl isomerase n=1 Tax=Atopobacter phocae TaxID=136492 RepID=UPI0004725A7E|nr:peptidylprolyl isomerase [Atopobacter phocae]